MSDSLISRERRDFARGARVRSLAPVDDDTSAIFCLCAGGFDDVVRLRRQRRAILRIGGCEAPGKLAKECSIRTSAGQRDANARSTFHDTSGDLDETQSEGCELGAEQRRALWHRLARGEHEPVGGGVQNQAELVGLGIAARGAIGCELCLVQFDEVLRFAACAIERLVEMPGATLERGDDVADVETFAARLQARYETSLASPTLGAVVKLLIPAQLLFPA